MARDPNDRKTATLTGTMVGISFKPKTPTMGGLVQIGNNDWVPWEGGKPKVDWSELQDKNPAHLDPCQHQPISVGSAQRKAKSVTQM